MACDNCDLPALLTQLREQRERAQLAEIERDTAQAQVRAKQSWIDGMKVDYDALNDEANTWRLRAEEAEEVAADLKFKRLHDAMAMEQAAIRLAATDTEGSPDQSSGLTQLRVARRGLAQIYVMTDDVRATAMEGAVKEIARQTLAEMEATDG